jgi:hypothetical protein
VEDGERQDGPAGSRRQGVAGGGGGACAARAHGRCGQGCAPAGHGHGRRFSGSEPDRGVTPLQGCGAAAWSVPPGLRAPGPYAPVPSSVAPARAAAAAAVNAPHLSRPRDVRWVDSAERGHSSAPPKPGRECGGSTAPGAVKATHIHANGAVWRIHGAAAANRAADLVGLRLSSPRQGSLPGAASPELTSSGRLGSPATVPAADPPNPTVPRPDRAPAIWIDSPVHAVPLAELAHRGPDFLRLENESGSLYHSPGFTPGNRAPFSSRGCPGLHSSVTHVPGTCCYPCARSTPAHGPPAPPSTP